MRTVAAGYDPVWPGGWVRNQHAAAALLGIATAGTALATAGVLPPVLAWPAAWAIVGLGLAPGLWLRARAVDRARVRAMDAELADRMADRARAAAGPVTIAHWQAVHRGLLADEPQLRALVDRDLHEGLRAQAGRLGVTTGPVDLMTQDAHADFFQRNLTVLLAETRTTGLACDDDEFVRRFAQPPPWSHHDPICYTGPRPRHMQEIP